MVFVFPPPWTIEELYADGVTHSWYAKGWHDPEAFAADLREELLAEGYKDFEVEVYTADEVAQIYGRWGTSTVDGERMHIMYEYDKPGRGRFKITRVNK
jgi:hypothetical protein